VVPLVCITDLCLGSLLIDGKMVCPAGLLALVGKGLPETYLFMEVLEPPQPGPEQQALALCQIDSKCSCFKIVVRVCTWPQLSALLLLPPSDTSANRLGCLLLCRLTCTCQCDDQLLHEENSN
jgi:hypothetical protein